MFGHWYPERSGILEKRKTHLNELCLLNEHRSISHISNNCIIWNDRDKLEKQLKSIVISMESL